MTQGEQCIQVPAGALESPVLSKEQTALPGEEQLGRLSWRGLGASFLVPGLTSYHEL